MVHVNVVQILMMITNYAFSFVLYNKSTKSN